MGKLQDCPFHQGKIPQQKVINEDGLLFPMVLLPQNVSDVGNTLQSFLHTIESNKEWIDDHLKEGGALLFKGFPLKSASDFNAVMEAFGWDEKVYEGAASRIRVEGRVFNANEAPLHQPIHFHHEMALYKDFPTKLAFYCEIAPPDGGQTAILLSHKITERMEEKHPEFVRKLKNKGLIYPAIIQAEDDPKNFVRLANLIQYQG
ncbi:clavaminate synthase-like protein At3g21360 [Cryptomeria japonica]|uniref:clavaminate synthase-like protein At3g21360 n=1 Tax=Cryptomeria japonica TaxID=3369 RepID=UPI0027DA496C|nr:clavaminate synthase-like protein At3g21360 [Cryptomeria japonica]